MTVIDDTADVTAVSPLFRHENSTEATEFILIPPGIASALPLCSVPALLDVQRAGMLLGGPDQR